VSVDEDGGMPRRGTCRWRVQGQSLLVEFTWKGRGRELVSLVASEGFPAQRWLDDLTVEVPGTGGSVLGISEGWMEVKKTGPEGGGGAGAGGVRRRLPSSPGSGSDFGEVVAVCQGRHRGWAELMGLINFRMIRSSREYLRC